MRPLRHRPLKGLGDLLGLKNAFRKAYEDDPKWAALVDRTIARKALFRKPRKP